MDPAPASARQALDMVRAGLAYLAAADTARLPAATQAQCLRELEQTGSVFTAARASFLAGFTAGQGYADDGDYRAPAVNRCAKLRRRAVGQQILVSETTYSIVADIMREDLSLVSVGPRRLEGHERPEQIYVLQHPEVVLEATVPED